MIVVQISAILFAIICAYGIKLNKKVFNPLTVFCGIWSVIFFLSSLGLYDLKDTSMYIYLLFSLGICSFIFGYVIDYKCIKHVRLVLKKDSCNKSTQYVPRYRLIYALLIFAIIFELIKAKDSVLLILGGYSLNDVLFSVRDSSADARGTISNVINNLVVGPFKFAIFPLCAYNIANKKKPILTLLIILLMGISVVSSGGRVFLIYLMICLCVSFAYSNTAKERINSSLKKIKKNKRKYIVLMCAFLLVFVGISISRSGQYLSKHMYLYFAMQPTMFETWAGIISQKGLVGFGEASLNGFTFHTLYLIKNILNISYPSHWYDVFNAVIDVDTSWKAITTTGLPANAYVSVFWYFYTDAREIGVLLFSFIYGMVSSYVYKSTVKRPNIRNVCIYSLFLFGVLDTYVRCRFTTGDYVGGLLLLLFVIFKREKKREDLVHD